MKISFNSKITFGFAFFAFVVWLIDCCFNGFSAKYFATSGSMDWGSFIDYFKLMSHSIGHANWNHLASNMMFILLLGPILEEKYGHADIFFMILFTTIITGLVNVIFFSAGVQGASGIVFMMILLAPIVGKADGTVPFALIVVVVLYLGKEVMNALSNDNISQMAHIVGGVMGLVFGFMISKFHWHNVERKGES